uniref:C2H2-type domain-containing protein n=1 Tax=Strongyloides papillosus TaxID=174720 RepID=A0A0N5C5L8_STREA
MDQTNSSSPTISGCGSEMNGILPEMFKVLLEQQQFNLQQNQVGHKLSTHQMDSDANPLIQSVIQYNAHMNLLNEIKNNNQVKQEFDASDINNTILGWQTNKQNGHQSDNIYQQLLNKINLNNISSKQDIGILNNALISGMQNRSATDNENNTLTSILNNVEQNSFNASQILDQLALLGVTTPTSVNGSSFNDGNNLPFNNHNITITEQLKASISPFSVSSQNSNNNSIYDINGQYQIRRDNQRSNTISSKSKDTYCEYCQKYFCNRYFLKIHKLRRHKVNDDDTPIKKYSLDYSGCRKESSGDGSNNIQEALVKELRAITQEKTNKFNIDGEVPRTCDICNKTFDDTLSLMTHKVNEHSFDPTKNLIINTPRSLENLGLSTSPVFATQINNNSTSPNSDNKNEVHSQVSSDDSVKIMEIIQNNNMRLQFNLPLPNTITSPLSSLATLQNTQQLKNINQQNPLSNLTGSQTFDCTSLTRKQSSQTDSTAEAFCNLCNKKVCNKYFLRTHMFKMHKIVIDENKSTIANVDVVSEENNMGLKFRCDICMENVVSRYELIKHKSLVHNIHFNDSYGRGGNGYNNRNSPTNEGSGNSGDENYNNLSFRKNIISSDDIEMKINQEVDDTLKKIKMEVGDRVSGSQEIPILHIKSFINDNSPNKDEPLSPGQVNVDDHNILPHPQATPSAKRHLKSMVLKKKVKKQRRGNPFNLPKSYRLFTCAFCDKVFISKLICKIHMKKYHEENVKEEAFNLSPNCSTTNKENVNNIDSFDSTVSKSVTPIHSLDLALFDGISSIEEHNEGHRVNNKEEGNNSNTSGSASPNSIHHDELFGKVVLDKPNPFLLQNFIVQYEKTPNIEDPYNDILPDDLKLQLPVKFLSDSPFELNLKFCPIPQTTNE